MSTPPRAEDDPGQREAVGSCPPPGNGREGGAPVIWSIGIYSGPSPLALRPAPECSNPVLQADDVTDARAKFVADPFLVRHGERWCMFFEVLDQDRKLGSIAVAESDDGFRWSYIGIVLQEEFHLSYPFVFAWQGRHYMIPESLRADEVRVYCAESFPRRWSFAGSLIKGRHADPSLHRGRRHWWLFTCPSSPRHDTMALFYAPSPLGPWRRHPRNPVVRDDPVTARPAGRPLVVDGRILRFAQQCTPDYGTAVHAMEITSLSQRSYSERPRGENPILGPSSEEWNKGGMHHLDAHRLDSDLWLAAVDGRSE